MGNNALKIVTFLVLMFFPLTCFSATYYVAQSSAGSGDGTSYVNRASVSYHNAGSGVFASLDGDTIYLTGTITSQITVPDGGTSVNRVVYDGDDGANPASLRGSDSFSIYTEKDFVTIRNVEFTLINNSAQQVIAAKQGADGIWIHDCTFENITNMTRPIEIKTWGSNGIKIYNNIIDASSGDVPYDTVRVTTEGISSPDLDNVEIYNNKITNCTHNLIAVYSAEGEAGINTVKIYNNELSSFSQPYCRPFGISSDDVNDIYIYNNYIHDNRAPAQCSGTTVHIYNNIFADTKNCCTASGQGKFNTDADCTSGTSSCETSMAGQNGTGMHLNIIAYTTIGPYYIYNNVFYNSAEAAIRFWNSVGDKTYLDLYIRNNIIINASWENGSPNDDESIEVFLANLDGDIYVNNNIFYDSGTDVFIDQSTNTGYTVAELNAETWGSANENTDPGLSDPANEEFWPDSSTDPVVDAGLSLGATYDGAWNPYQSPFPFSTSIPTTVDTRDQDSYGSGWEIGAYVYSPSIIMLPGGSFTFGQ